MRIVILITVIESSALAFWMIYSYHRRGLSRQASALLRPSSVSAISNPKHSSISHVDSAHWSFINQWHPEEQRDDRQQMNGSVAVSGGAAPSIRRSLARQSHQLMYKKWSKERHD
jgi:hypothetical protein